MYIEKLYTKRRNEKWIIMKFRTNSTRIQYYSHNML